jgi:hypothetical protein
MNLFDTRPEKAKPKNIPWDELYAAELEDFRRTKEIMEREKNEREAAERKIREEKEEAERVKETELFLCKNFLPYSDQLAQEICERIAIGELLINICIDEHLPTMRRCNQWLREHTDFNALYQSAINDRLNIFEEEVIKIADDMRHDFKTVIKNGLEKRAPDPDMVARARLRIEVRFKHLKAGRPQRWGDVSTLITKSEDPFDTSKMSAEELERQIADIERKSGIGRAA